MDCGSVLIARLSAIGDVVFALPVLHSLRRARPDLRIGWLLDDRTAALLEGHPWIDDLIVYPRNRLRGWWKRPLAARAILAAHKAAMRARSYDVVLDLQGNLKAAMQLRWIRGARRIGFARGFTREPTSFLMHDCVTPPPDSPHRIDKFLSILGPLGIAASRDYPPGPDLPAERVERIARRLREMDLDSGPLIAIQPGVSRYGRDKQWPVERFAEVARRLADEFDARCVLIHAPNEASLAKAVREQSGGIARDDFHTKDLQELLALLARVDLFVGSDSGPLHLASWLGRPAIGIYGPTDPAVYGPFGRRSLALFHGERPLPPRRRTEPSALMLRVTVDEVLERARHWLRMN